MPTYQRSVEIHAPIENVFHFHDDTKNLVKITPPDTKVEILRMDAAGKGQHVLLRITQFKFFKTMWEIVITAYDPPRRMVDEQLQGPFKNWTQVRQIEDLGGGVTRLTDTVDYKLPLGFLGQFVAGFLVARKVRKMFEYRQIKTKEILESAA